MSVLKGVIVVPAEKPVRGVVSDDMQNWKHAFDDHHEIRDIYVHAFKNVHSNKLHDSHLSL